MWKKHTQPPPEIRLSKSSEFLKTEYFRWRFVCVIPTGKRMKETVFAFVKFIAANRRTDVRAICIIYICLERLTQWVRLERLRRCTVVITSGRKF